LVVVVVVARALSSSPSSVPAHVAQRKGQAAAAVGCRAGWLPECEAEDAFEARSVVVAVVWLWVGGLAVCLSSVGDHRGFLFVDVGCEKRPKDL
jgi:hypothetical protein